MNNSEFKEQNKPRYHAVDMFCVLDAKTGKHISYEEMKLGESCSFKLPEHFSPKEIKDINDN